MENTGTGKAGYPTYFLTKHNLTINDMDLVADEFNDFFVNVGSNLANEDWY